MADLLDVRDLKIGATVYPPGEPPKDITIVHGVSFTLEKGRVLGLIGESGAGKSTIGLAALAYGRGGVRITGGEVLLDGEDILALGSGIRSIRGNRVCRSEEHTSELQSLMRISYAVFCLKKKKT